MDACVPESGETNTNDQCSGVDGAAVVATTVPNRDDAERFIEALTGSRRTAVTFQTFPDNKDNPQAKAHPPLILHGTVAERWEALVEANQIGHGVFVMVNKGNGRGRSAEDVVRLRALFIDDDGTGPSPVAYAAGGGAFAAMTPSITVQSRHGQHNYWLVDDGDILELFKPAQQRLAAHFGTDGKVSDVCRVMRLPGFDHLKSMHEPFRVTLVQASATRHRVVDVLAAYPPPAGAAPSPVASKAPATSGAPAPAHMPVTGEESAARVIERARAYVAKVPAAVQSKHGDDATFKLCAKLVRGLRLSDEEAFAVLGSWNEKCAPPWPEEELRQKISNARQYGKEEFGSMLDADAGQMDQFSWNGFADAQHLAYCVPVLNKHFALFASPDGTQRTYGVNARHEATMLQTEKPMEQVLYDSLKEQFKSVPPHGALGHAIMLWEKECPKLATEPEPFCFGGDDRLCFKRFDWVPREAAFPAWEEFLSRLSDRDAFMAFVWSCFEPRNDSRQFIWLIGNGEDGKSKVYGVLQDVFGAAATGITNSHIKGGSQFLNSFLYGKRVVFYADCKNTKFGMTEFLRNCTSGDPVLVEFKGKTAFSARLHCKLFVASNGMPEISSQNSDTSRLILVEVAESKNKDDPTWPSRLADELPGFLWACRNVYEARCAGHGKIPLNDVSRELVEDAAAQMEEEFESYFAAGFREVRGNEMKAVHLAMILRRCGLRDNQKQGDFKAWAARKHHVQYCRRGKGAVYVGIAPSGFGAMAIENVAA